MTTELPKTYDPAAVEAWSDMVISRPGRLVLCGMGKSGLIAQKISATLASTGTPAFFVHPGEAQHGDLGMIAREELEQLQIERLQATLNRVYRSVAFYRTAFDAHGVNLERLKDLKASELMATVDTANLKPGRHRLKVNLTLPDGLRLAAGLLLGLLEGDEYRELVLQYLGGYRDRALRVDRAARPELEYELVVIGPLPDPGVGAGV